MHFMQSVVLIFAQTLSATSFATYYQSNAVKRIRVSDGNDGSGESTRIHRWGGANNICRPDIWREQAGCR